MPKTKRHRPMSSFTLDSDVLARLRRESETSLVPMSRLVNRALRKALNLPSKPTKPAA